jgi:hypothetical protein
MGSAEYAAVSLVTLAQIHERLSLRDLVARAIAQLIAQDRYHPEQHPALGHPDAAPLRPDEHGQLLAVDREIAETVVHSRQARVWRARQAGTDWASIADALGLSVQAAHEQYAAWIDRQAYLWGRYAEPGKPHVWLDPEARVEARRLLDDTVSA